MLKSTARTARIIAIEAFRISIAIWPNETALSRLRFICSFHAGEVNRFTLPKAFPVA